MSQRFSEINMPIDWFSISGRDRLAAWQGLAAFVDTLVYRYDLQREIMTCWWQHNDAVEELTALWQVRLSSFLDGASLNAAMSWQDTFYKSRARLAGIFSSCREGHVDARVHGWMSNEAREALASHIQEEASAMRERTISPTPLWLMT